MGAGAHSWTEVVDEARVRPADRQEFLDALNWYGPLGAAVVHEVTPMLASKAAFKRILELSPCLYAQINEKVTARGVVHLCEVTLGAPITSANVYQAFQVQHPATGTTPFQYPPRQAGAGGGDIMEALCAEVLSNHGVPAMLTDAAGWPIWSSPGHLSLNAGKLNPLKLYGDLLVPAAPHNLLISVKSEAARERFVVSGNRLESVGFGFFNDASEFWTQNRMNLLKRWGFVAVYMPAQTLALLNEHLAAQGTHQYAININGRPLYRPLEDFGRDIARVVGKLTIDL